MGWVAGDVPDDGGLLGLDRRTRRVGGPAVPTDVRTPVGRPVGPRGALRSGRDRPRGVRPAQGRPAGQVRVASTKMSRSAAAGLVAPRGAWATPRPRGASTPLATVGAYSGPISGCDDECTG